VLKKTVESKIPETIVSGIFDSTVFFNTKATKFAMEAYRANN